MVKAKKHLGQHFLTDLSIASRIVESKSTHCKNVLEIGPGTGVLTQYLHLQENINFKVCEIDRESVVYLGKHYPDLTIIPKDFLKLDLKEFFEDEFMIIGNFPYNISSQIFFKVLEYKHQVTEVVGMLQKEVAERLASPHGSKKYGILSVFLQAYYDVEYLFTVSEDVFDPPPKVKSGVIRVIRNDVQKLDCDEKLFFRVVKQGFNNRRKTLRNALKPLGLPPEVVAIDLFSLRAEQLSVPMFVELTNIVEKGMA